MKKLVFIAALFLFLACYQAQAASITFEVDPLGQEFDAINLYMANAPRDFVFSDPPIYSGQAARFTVSNLSPEQTYKFAATLTKGNITSPISNIVQQKTPAAYAVPSITTAINGTEAVFTFDTGTTIPTRYLVRIAEDPVIPSSTDGDGTLYESATNPLKITDLVQGKKYNFYGRYSVGTVAGPKSATGSITMPTVLTIKAPGLVIINVE